MGTWRVDMEKTEPLLLEHQRKMNALTSANGAESVGTNGKVSMHVVRGDGM